jgi:hypothetical protein
VSAKFSPFVVVGSSKSGTTWLQKMLDSHPQIRCHFQLPIFPLRNTDLFYPSRVVYKSVKSPYRDVFTDNAEEKKYKATLDFICGLNLLNPDYSDSLSKGYDRAQRMYIKGLQRKLIRTVVQELLSDTADKEIFGTKAYTDLHELFDAFPDAKVIHIVRDGRDVCVSKRFHTLRKGIYYMGDEKSQILRLFNGHLLSFRIIQFLRRRFNCFGEDWYMRNEMERPLFTRMSLTKFAEDWRRIVEYILTFNRKYPEKLTTVRYERLIDDGPRQVENILSFLNADADSKTVDTLIEKTRFDRMNKGDKNSFFRKGISGDWKNYFNDDDVRVFKSIAGQLLLALGYESDDTWNKNTSRSDP